MTLSGVCEIIGPMSHDDRRVHGIQAQIHFAEGQELLELQRPKHRYLDELILAELNAFHDNSDVRASAVMQ